MRRLSILLSALLFSLSGCAVPFVQQTVIEDPSPYTGQMAPTAAEAAVDTPAHPSSLPTDDPFYGVNITFAATGDNLIHPNIYMDARKRGTAEKEYDFLPVYADVAAWITEADFAFINQETVMAGESYGYSGYPRFNSPRQLGMDLTELGFDIINVANNHMLDMGSAGLADTVDFWKSQPVTLLGVYEGTNAPVLLEKDGVTIALLSYTYSTNGFSEAGDAIVRVPYIDTEQILADVRTAREQRADIIITSLHWGNENAHTPTTEQQTLTKALADAGVDVILGHHSHCLQPIEWISGENGHETLCIYSLGNCISGMEHPINMVGGFLTFSIVSDGSGGVRVNAPRFLPTVFYYGPNWFNTRLYPLENYTDEIASTHGVKMHGYTLSAAEARKIVTDVIDAQFLPDWLS